MFQSNLPLNCPPTDAHEDEKWLYRILKSTSVCEEEFENYVTIYSHKVEYKKMCGAYAISLYELKEKAIENAKKNPVIGTYITKILIKPQYGKLHCGNTKTGHYNLWLYTTFDASKVEHELIEPIV
ncbi:MAG: hypothetical protein ABI723_15525 [Bacteroidia bacterium]